MEFSITLVYKKIALKFYKLNVHEGAKCAQELNQRYEANDPQA